MNVTRLGSITAALVVLGLCSTAFGQLEPVPQYIPTHEYGPPPDDLLDFGEEGLPVPPVPRANVNPPRTVRLLGEAFARASGYRRVQLMREIGLCALPEGIPFVRRALRDQDPDIRAEAAVAAAGIGDPALLDDLQPLLADEHLAVRRHAIIAAAELAAERTEDSPAVLAGLRDEDHRIRIAAMRRARTAGEARTIVQMLGDLPPAEQVEAIRALGRMQATDQAADLIPFLNDTIAHRAAAVDALGLMGAADHAPAVLAALEDPHPTVRRAAVDALRGVVDISQRQQRSIAMLRDPDLSVREAAARLLGEHPLVEGVAPLVAQLGEPYRPLHRAAREALIITEPADASETAIAAAVQLLDDSHPRRREDGSYILGRLGSNAGLERHIELVNLEGQDPAEMDWRLMGQAAESLGLIRDTRASEMIARFINRGVRGLPAPADMHRQGSPELALAEAVVAAGRLRHAPALGDILRIFRAGSPLDQSAQLRAACIWAWGVLDTSPANEEAVMERLIGVYYHPFEGDEPKFEAVKTMGNMKLSVAIEDLDSFRQTAGYAPMKWVAQWGFIRITGSDGGIPYTSPVMQWTADVSITDITPRQ